MPYRWKRKDHRNGDRQGVAGSVAGGACSAGVICQGRLDRRVEEGVVGTDAGSGVGRSSRIGSRVRRTESSQRHIAKEDANRFVEGDAGHSARPFRDLRYEADNAVLTPVPLDDKILSM